ncbi:unnamed protein product [Calicophoron daubneyi]|uniref:Uncharacterized protein n=1 Tax=Calicophoron daubneyi TaxID=300641 RepID=A0AAV2TYY7_CALDB
MLFLTARPVAVALMLIHFQFANESGRCPCHAQGEQISGGQNHNNFGKRHTGASSRTNNSLSHNFSLFFPNICRVEFIHEEFSVMGSIPPSVSTQDIGFHAIRSVLRGNDFSTTFGYPVVKSTRSDNIFFYYSGPCDEELIFIRGIGVTPGALREALFEMATFDSMLIAVDHPNSGRFLRTLNVPARVYAIASVHHIAMSGMKDMIEKPFTVLWARRILQAIGKRWAFNFLFYSGLLLIVL